MHNLLINDYGDVTDKLSDLQPHVIEDDYAKISTLLFNNLYVAQLYDADFDVPAAIKIGSPIKDAYYGTNYSFLLDRGIIGHAPPGSNDVLLPYIENRLEMIERKTGERCLIHPRFLNPQHDRQLALSIGFLSDIVPPPGNVPLEEILRFKERHGSELLAFWDMVYEVALDPTGLLKSQPEHILRTKLSSMLDDLEQAQRSTWGGSILRRCSLQVALPIGAIASLALHQIGVNVAPYVLTVISGVAFGIEVLPNRHPPSDQARAMTFALEARRALRR